MRCIIKPVLLLCLLSSEKVFLNLVLDLRTYNLSGAGQREHTGSRNQCGKDKKTPTTATKHESIVVYFHFTECHWAIPFGVFSKVGCPAVWIIASANVQHSRP